MAELFSKHPIKITLATAAVVLMSIIGGTYNFATTNAKTDSRVGVLENKFVEYELKDVPTMKEILSRVDRNVQKLIDKK